MMIKVIYHDGSLGLVREALLAKLIGQGNIVAYQPFEDWIELRRKRNDGYKGLERRTSTLH